MGYRKIGIATCIGLLEETNRLASVLKAQGFVPVSVCCKTGSIDKLEMGLCDSCDLSILAVTVIKIKALSDLCVFVCRAIPELYRPLRRISAPAVRSACLPSRLAADCPRKFISISLSHLSLPALSVVD